MTILLHFKLLSISNLVVDSTYGIIDNILKGYKIALWIIACILKYLYKYIKKEIDYIK